MSGLFDALYGALGWLMRAIYGIVNNYGMAIIIFTVLTKVILFPLNLKQQKSAAQMQKIKPLIDEIQKKYANNREKISEETMKVYQEYGINPTGGCLPMIVQLPIIWALYRIIQQPYTYILHWTDERFAQYGISFASKNARRSEIQMVAEKIKQGVISHTPINFRFLGLDLAETPSIHKFSALWVIPVIAAVLTFLQSKYMYIGLSKEELELRKRGKKQTESTNGRPPRPGDKKDGGNVEQITNSMTYFMPIMTLWFTFILPAGIGLYWITGSALQILLTYISNRHIIPNMKTKAKGGKANDIEETRKKLREKRKDS
ncbi:MAG: YidC/Oxa1 family membrane protein insertase [Bacillota bacterium]|nr:YidC/Oxa1 family membrane protein insertase [Bacillota bacterium]